MGGINTLGGLNNVSVDYRPVLEPTVQNTGNANQPQQAPGAEAAIENPPVERAEAKSVVRELDVLLLGAASKSIAANAAENVRTVGKSLVDKGVLTKKAANLNLATQDTAKEFGCADLVVKYSVGNHKGQFGVFMEKAKGVSGSKFAKKSTSGDDGIPPSEMHKITDPAEQTKIKGDVAQKLNKLMWLDLITGQGDRHWGNYFIHVDKDTHEVTVKGIDNDASFSATRIGLMKFALSKDKTALYFDQLKEVCQKLHGKNWKREYDNRVSKDPAIVRNGNTMTIDLTKATTHEARMAIIHTMGLQSIALPEEIDEDFYNHLIAMDNDPAKKREYLNSIAPRISPEALSATEAASTKPSPTPRCSGSMGRSMERNSGGTRPTSRE